MEIHCSLRDAAGINYQWKDGLLRDVLVMAGVRGEDRKLLQIRMKEASLERVVDTSCIGAVTLRFWTMIGTG